MSEIWGNLNNNNNKNTSYFNGVLYHDLTLANLVSYIEGYFEKDICEDSMVDFFGKDNLSKIIPGTTRYIPHELFLHNFSEEKIYKILSFIFNYLYLHIGTTDKSYTYLHTLLSLPKTKYKSDFILKLIKQASEFNFNFNYKPLDEIPIYNWAIGGRSYAGKIVEFRKLLPNYYDYNFRDSNNLNANELIYLIKILLHNCYYKDDYMQDDLCYETSISDTSVFICKGYFGESKISDKELLFEEYNLNSYALKHGLYNSIFFNDFKSGEDYDCNEIIRDFYMKKLNLKYEKIPFENYDKLKTGFLVRKRQK